MGWRAGRWELLAGPTHPRSPVARWETGELPAAWFDGELDGDAVADAWGGKGAHLEYAGTWLSPPWVHSPVRLALWLAHVDTEAPGFPVAEAWRLARAGRQWPGVLGWRWLRCTASPGAATARDVCRLAALLREEATRQDAVEAAPLADDAWVLPLRTPTLPPATHTNCVVVGRHAPLVVDPGPEDPAEIDHLVAWLDAHTGPPSRVVLTHEHRDHVGAAGALARRYAIPVAASRQTAERVAARAQIDEFVEEGDVLVAGSWRLRALHTPGHAAGHLVLHDEARGLMLAGDMVAGEGTIVVNPPDGDMAAYLAQLERLAAVSPARMIPAHGPPIVDPATLLRHYIGHRLWRERRVLDAVRTHGPAPVSALLPHVYGDVDSAAHAIAERQLLAHLLKLLAEGKVRRRGRRWLPAR